jgi:hypothetical protein
MLAVRTITLSIFSRRRSGNWFYQKPLAKPTNRYKIPTGRFFMGGEDVLEKSVFIGPNVVDRNDG